MSGLHVKKGDNVMVITGGSDKGLKGKVLSVDLDNDRVVVEGINKIKKHQKPKGQKDPGGIIVKEAPIHVSNVMVICPKCKKPTRTGSATIEENGKKIKVRVCKQEKCGAYIKTIDATK